MPLLLTGSLAHAQAPAKAEASRYSPSAASRWLDISLEATAREVDRNGARPTILSRTLAIAMTAMYDAWAAYDDKAVGTRLGATLRRPAAERTLANREKAIAYATYRALVDVYPQDQAWCAEQMRKMGFDPNDTSKDLATPQGVGNAAAAAVIAYRHQDGANQLGDERGSKGGAYSDYTYYTPVNSHLELLDADRWQPITFDNGKGGKVTPGFLTPHWYRVKPFALERPDQFRPPPPPLVGSKQLLAEVDEIIAYNASLTPEQKAIVEFMRDGPRSTGQSGHWLKFAQAVSRRDRHTLEQDVKLYFAVANVAMDAFIASWEAKRFYDTSRPWTLVRHYYAGRKIKGWAGPGKGVIELPAESWHPYSPSTFITPPFPGYVSGHSTVSAACAKVLELSTGSDTFGEVEKRTAGELTEADFPCTAIQQGLGQAPAGASQGCVVSLKLPTFSATAEMAGISRVMGGYHIQADNVEGLALGRKVANFTWPRMQAYFNGAPGVATPGAP
ncbi:vanadium-dependent haloperoxidase [Hyalangium rubrum]|uniref:Vanadium-dependent haloperoxidase n=1 Tax=Hyalangium rubrum TaxID=3103134 RepID=A0ABU5GZQ7_9BACT|nr:vanadium-dependent haloperoxidase [Hyalangium sp. s54d21]MDY7226688.1 vanadium-dependent haloperoxidase [Hyalangium sp. s54d21]